MKLIKEQSSRLKYFPEENYEKFLRLKRVVKSAGSRQGTAEELDECVGGGSNAGGGGGGLGELSDTCGSVNKGERNESIPESGPSSARNLFDWTKSTEYTNRDCSIEDGLGEARLQLGRKHRRLASASEPTISSRNKVRPEPRFQKVAASQLFSRMRKGSHLISKNPERYLQELVDGRGDDPTSPMNFHDTNSFSSLISSFNQDSAAESYKKTLEKLQEKCKQTKSRALLLNLGANPAIQSKMRDRSGSASSRSSVVGEFASYFSGESGKTSTPDELIASMGGGDNPDFVLQSFLDEIRCANVDNVMTWVRTVATLNDFELPFGLPPSGVLKIPVGNPQEGSNGQFSRCSVEFIKSGLEEFFLLDAEYHAKLEELVVKITDNFRELETAAWGEKDSALLFYLMNLTGQSGNPFSSEKLCTEVATRIFPFYGRDDIIGQKYRLKVKKALEEKRNSLIKQWLKDKEALVKKLNSAWEDIQKKERFQQDFQNERKLQQNKCQYWTELLEKMRKENRKRVRAIQTLIEPLEEEMKNRLELQDRHEKSRRLQQRELLDKFQRLRVESKQEQKKRQEEIQAALEKDKKIRQIHNRTRVHLRKKEYEQKMENMKELERKREEDRQARMDLLEKTKEKIDIAYNPANIVQDTHSSFVRSIEIQQLIQIQDGDAQKAVKFFQERYSFSAETLWKDSRVRLEAKLREAGLIDNSYARHVLQAMQPKVKPHLLSQIKFDD